MPAYEFFFITRRLTKGELVSCLKRTAELILNSNGILRKIENLGTRTLPFRIPSRIQGVPGHKTGNYFLYHFDSSEAKLDHIMECIRLDMDLIRYDFSKKEQKIPTDYECTLEEEFLPPTYRKSVQSLLEKAGQVEQKFEKYTEEMP